MTAKWLLAQVKGTEPFENCLGLKIRFKLLEPVVFHGEHYDHIYAGFSNSESGVQKLQEFLDAVNYPLRVTDSVNKLPTSIAYNRYCRLCIEPRAFGTEQRLQVIGYTTVNRPTKIPAEVRVNMGLVELHIPARVVDGKLVIEASPEPVDDTDNMDVW